MFGEHALLDRRDELEGVALSAAPGSATVVSARPPAATAVAATTGTMASAGQGNAPAASRPQGSLVRGDSFDYQLIDRPTQQRRTVVLRVTRVDDEQVSFNEGARVERPDGEVVSLTVPLLGELDNATPPGGWLQGGKLPRGTWPIKFSTGVGAARKGYDLTARAGREQAIRVPAGQFQALRVDLEGWYEQTSGHIPSRAPYRAVVWISSELRRPIRFEAQSRSSSNTGFGFIMIDETAELVALSRD